MSVIMVGDHKRILKSVCIKHWVGHMVLVLMMLVLIYTPAVLKLEAAIFNEGLQVVKGEYINLSARRELLGLLRSKSLTVGQALDLVDTITSQTDIPLDIVFAMLSQESEFNPNAVSKAGARGLSQVMPVVWKDYSTRISVGGVHDVSSNVKVGLMFLADLKAKFGDWPSALRAYFAGPENANNMKYNWYANAVLAKAAVYKKDLKFKY